MDGQTGLVPVERIERAILSIRGEKVMLDSDLAELYGVETPSSESGSQTKYLPFSGRLRVPTHDNREKRGGEQIVTTL